MWRVGVLQAAQISTRVPIGSTANSAAVIASSAAPVSTYRRELSERRGGRLPTVWRLAPQRWVDQAPRIVGPVLALCVPLREHDLVLYVRRAPPLIWLVD